jgi:hypothetical protein
MAITNYERIGKAMELLRDGIRPYVEREMAAARGKNWLQEAIQAAQIPDGPPLKQELSDPAFLLKILWQGWNDVFRVKLGQSERTLVSELMEVRKKWAHMGTFSYDDTYRALDSIERLLTSVSAGQSDEVNRMKRDVMRVKFDEERRLEQRKSARSSRPTRTFKAADTYRPSSRQTCGRSTLAKVQRSTGFRLSSSAGRTSRRGSASCSSPPCAG